MCKYQTEWEPYSDSFNKEETTYEHNAWTLLSSLKSFNVEYDDYMTI